VPDPAVRSIASEPLTESAWAPFGWLPADDTDPRDADLTYEFALGDPHVNVIAHTYDEVGRGDRGPVCDCLYRHDTHTQTLMPLNVDSVIAVAPRDVAFDSIDDLGSIKAFLLHPLERLTLFRGTWHWGPFPIERQSVRLFNVQGKRYAEDNARVDLAQKVHTVIEVIP
jgi:ureidoglycolate hydrolase